MAEPKIRLPAYGQIAYFWISKVDRLHTFWCTITPLFGVRSPPFPIYILYLFPVENNNPRAHAESRARKHALQTQPAICEYSFSAARKAACAQAPCRALKRNALAGRRMRHRGARPPPPRHAPRSALAVRYAAWRGYCLGHGLTWGVAPYPNTTSLALPSGPLHALVNVPGLFKIPIWTP